MYINNNLFVNYYFTMSKKINNYYSILHSIKNKILQNIDTDIKKELTQNFTRFEMYNNILNNINCEGNTEIFNVINNNIDHFDENNNECSCSKCNEIKLFQRIYHELLLVQTNI